MSQEKIDFDKIEPANGVLTEPIRGLQTKLIILTIIFVMIAEVLAFVPSVANTRLRWLNGTLDTAAAASVVVDGQDHMPLPKQIQSEALMATGTKRIVLRKDGASRVVASVAMPPQIARHYNLDETSPVQAIIDAFDTLIFGGDRIIRVTSQVADNNDMQIELVLSDTQLRNSMLIYSRNVLFISLIIAAITSGLLFFSVNRLMILPIRRLSQSMQRFSEQPEDATRIIKPAAGDDELWLAEQQLSAMQTQLHTTLRQQRRLADLGLAVSKINHDMRNILTTAQLLSDRMANVDDPMVKRFAPKLLNTIDRAVSYSSQVMSYGSAQESEPKRRLVQLHVVANELGETLAGDLENTQIEYVNEVPANLEIEADHEQIFRVIHNLSRNAVQALKADDEDDKAAVIKRLRVGAIPEDNAVRIFVDDTGPGMPAKAKEHLFKPFRGSARVGGTGLGLAIAKELIEAHGGTISLAEKPSTGTRFEIVIPTPV